MADIPAWAWIGTGVFVVIVAALVGGMGFFVILGAGCVAWGAFRMARDYLVGPEKKRLKPWEQHANDLAEERRGLVPAGDEKGFYHQVSGEKPKHEHIGHRSHKVHAVKCPACKTEVWSTAHFCHFCGIRLKNP